MSFENGSASASDRTIACPASLVLPRVRRSNEYSDRGHGIHHFVCAVLGGAPVETALTQVAEEHRETCRRIQWRQLGAELQSVRSECAYALDPFARTARFLGVDVGRGYDRFGLTADEVPGSLDIDGEEFDGTPNVIDLKTGYQDVPDAEDNGQGLFFGAVKYIITGSPRVRFRVCKLKPDGTVIETSSHVYTALELDSFLDEYETALTLARAARAIYKSGGVPDVSTGDHCRYCEAMEACPAYTSLARAMVASTEDLESRVATLTLSEAGQAWRKAKRIEAMLDRVLEALKDRARQEPLPTEDGKAVRPVTFERSSFDQHSALALLGALGATPQAIASLYRTTTVEQIKECNDQSTRRVPRRTKAA